jgi:seryl-tRNA synthetase
MDMNKIFLLSLSIAFLASCSSSKDLQSTQDSLTRATKERNELEHMLSECEKKNGVIENELGLMKGDYQEQYNNINELTSELQYTQEQLASVTRQMQEASDDYGVWYRVQIGAYEDRSIDSDLDTTDELALEGSDVQKVSVGRFREYEKAKRLQDHLRSMGVADAWIVTFKDGNRVPIDSVKKN